MRERFLSKKVLLCSKNVFTVRVKIITGSLVILENSFPENYRYRYRPEIRMNYHYRYRLGARSRPLISIDSQLPSRKSFELISSKNVSEGEKPSKIREKKFPGTKFLGTFGPPPTEKTEKIGKIKGTLVRKVPGHWSEKFLGTSVPRNLFFFFFLCGFSAP